MADSKQFKIKELLNLQPKTLPASGALGDLAMDENGDLFKWDGAAWAAAGVAGADDVPYDNSTSGLTATDVQAAIDEVEGRLDTAEQDLSTLSPITNLSGDGIVVITGAGTAALRDIGGTTDQIDVTDGDGVAGNPTIALADNPVIPGTGSLTIPVGTTAERPMTPTDGMIRRNTDLDKFEGYDSVSSTWKPIGGGGRDILAPSNDPLEVAAGVGITGITDVDQVVYVDTASGEVDVAANPQVEDGLVDGQVLTIIGTSDVNYPLFQDGAGLALNGEFEALANFSLQIIWDEEAQIWKELTRSEN